MVIPTVGTNLYNYKSKKARFIAEPFRNSIMIPY